jgi:hypothetical protein
VVEVNKELALGFEVTELEDEMTLGGSGMHRADRHFFRRAQIKIELSIFFREARQPIQVVNFSLGEDRQRRELAGVASGRGRAAREFMFSVEITDCRLISPFDLL